MAHPAGSLAGHSGRRRPDHFARVKHMSCHAFLWKGPEPATLPNQTARHKTATPCPQFPKLALQRLQTTSQPINPMSLQV